MDKFQKQPSTLGELLKERMQAYEGESAHYKSMGVEPWDVVDTWPLEQQIGAHRHNILKYAMRMGSKDDRLKEAKKIRHYAEKLVSVLEKATNNYGTDS